MESSDDRKFLANAKDKQLLDQQVQAQAQRRPPRQKNFEKSKGGSKIEMSATSSSMNDNKAEYWEELDNADGLNQILASGQISWADRKSVV